MTRRVLVGLVSLLLVIFLGPAANAATVKVKDKRGDAVAAHDITQTLYNNGRDAFIAKMWFRDLKRSKKLQTVHVRIGLPRSDSSIDFASTRGKDGKHRSRLTLWELEHQTSLACARMRVSWDYRQNFVWVKIPQSCMDSMAFHRGARFGWSSSARGKVGARDLDRTPMIRVLYN